MLIPHLMKQTMRFRLVHVVIFVVHVDILHIYYPSQSFLPSLTQTYRKTTYTYTHFHLSDVGCLSQLFLIFPERDLRFPSFKLFMQYVPFRSKKQLQHIPVRAGVMPLAVKSSAWIWPINSCCFSKADFSEFIHVIYRKKQVFQ